MLEDRKFVITGKTNDSYVLKNTYDRFFSYEDMKIIKKIDKYLDNKSKKVDMNISDDKIIISPARSEKNKEIVLTLQETNKLLDDIFNMYSKKIYSYSSIKTIIENKNKTINLSFLDKIIVCSELLYLLKTNERKSADLQLLGQSKDSGILKISKNLPIGTKLIEESYTGYYKKVIYEVK
ncbi:cRISPR-associated endonuclease Csn1 family [Firmicutes bacterium CAG:449]|nr:cRISPR-associated endonuclease Csn1 family [Firmicutes bacterium CAG:449]